MKRRMVTDSTLVLCFAVAAFCSVADAPSAEVSDDSATRQPAERDLDDVAARFPANAPATYNPETVTQWYDKTYFNLLVDYFLYGKEENSEELRWGAGLTLENLTRSLNTCRPGYMIIHAKGHQGYTAFTSSLHTERPNLADDPLAVVRQATRQCDVKLILYYSGLHDGTAAERHPEWRPVLQPGGKRDARPAAGIYHRIVPLCPSSRYFEDWVSVHLREMITRYDPDGIWVDGDWDGACYCDRCKRLAIARFGDTGAVETPQFQAWMRNEFRRKFAAVVRGLKPSCLYSSGNTTPAVDFGFANHMDYQSGDWFSPSNHRLRQSFAMRRYTTLGIPYEAMTCDTSLVVPWTTVRSLPKTLDRMLQEGAGVLINGGKWCYWTYPDPEGALLPSQMRIAKACQDWAAAREDLWLGTQSARWTAVVGNPLGRFRTPEYSGAAKALVELHRSPDLIDLRQLKEPIAYRLLVLPDVKGLNGQDVAMLERFVRAGGGLLSLGSTAADPQAASLLGIQLIKEDAVKDEGHVLLADGSPACLVCNWSQVRPADAEVWWKLYRSWGGGDPPGMKRNYALAGRLNEEHPEEAGMPAVTARKLGRGVAVHVAGDPLPDFWKLGYPTVRPFLRQLLDRMQPDPLLATDAPSWVEVSLRTRGNELFVHFLNGNPGFDMSAVGGQDFFVGEIPEVGPYEASICCADKPAAVFLEPGHKPLDAQWHDGRLQFTVPRLKIHACVRVQPWSPPK